MGKYLEYYCENNNRRLNQLVDKILERHFGWLPQKDYDDMYSIAGQTVWQCEMQFNKQKKTKFKTFLTSCLLKKFKTRITYCNRSKRKLKDKDGNPIQDISLNTIVDEENGVEFSEMLVGDMDVFEQIKSVKDGFGVNTQRYMGRLTNQQQEIALLVSQGYTPLEIQNKLCIDSKRYQSQWDKMTSLRKTACLCKERK